jgi:Cft2 family RNA processing exonuclease
VDAAGRVLEVSLLLDKYWERAKLYFALVLAAPQARAVLESAKTQLNWMSDAVLQAFERTRDNPFALRCGHPLAWRMAAVLAAGMDYTGQMQRSRFGLCRRTRSRSRHAQGLGDT